MKKILVLTCILCCISGAAAYAAVGDVADHIYSTDIQAFINGVEVESYAIDGKTVVVVEDVTEDYGYNDQLRTLIVGGFAPYNLKAGEAERSSATGQIIGDVYETDIKTYVYDTELTAYALDGKTAVALEDLGADQAWSELGGKYKWDPNARTISLETIYSLDKTRRLLSGRSMRIKINAGKTEADAEFYYDKLSVGGSIDIVNEPNYVNTAMIPVYAVISGERKEIGFCVCTASKLFEVEGYDMGNGEIRHGGDVTGGKAIYKLESLPRTFIRLEEELVEAGAAEVAIEELTPIDEVVKDYILYRACTVNEQFDTQEYSFVYMIGSTPHGGTDVLLLIRPDGAYHDYSSDFESVSLYGTKHFDNVRIDRENEKVHFRYDAEYVLDLRTGVLEKTM